MPSGLVGVLGREGIRDLPVAVFWWVLNSKIIVLANCPRAEVTRKPDPV